MVPRRVPALLVAVLLVGPLVAAKDGVVPADPECQPAREGNGVEVTPCLTFPTRRDDAGTVWGNASLEWRVNGTGPWNISFALESLGLPVADAEAPAVNDTDGTLSTAFSIDAASGESILNLEWEVVAVRFFPPPTNRTDNGTGNGTGNATGNETGNQTQQSGAPPAWREVFRTTFVFTVQVPGRAPPTGISIGWFVGAGALVFLLVAGSAVLIRRGRKPPHQLRSRTLQQLDAERRGPPRAGGGGGAGAAGPGDGGGASRAAAVTAPPRPSTSQRAILEARRADAQRMIDMARLRREKGELSEHQFKLIQERKQKELVQIDDEIRGLGPS